MGLRSFIRRVTSRRASKLPGVGQVYVKPSEVSSTSGGTIVSVPTITSTPTSSGSSTLSVTTTTASGVPSVSPEITPTVEPTREPESVPKPSSVSLPSEEDTLRVGFGEATRRVTSSVWDWVKSPKGVAPGYIVERDEGVFDPYKQVGERRTEEDVAYYEPEFGTGVSGTGFTEITYGDVKGRARDIYGIGLGDLPSPSREAEIGKLSSDISGEISTEYQGKIDTGLLTLEEATPLAEAEYKTRYAERVEPLAGYYEDVEKLGIGTRPTGEALARYTPIVLETGALVGASVVSPVGLGIASTYIVGAGAKDISEGFYDQTLTTGQKIGKIALGTGMVALGFTGVGASARAVERGVIAGEIEFALERLGTQEMKIVELRVQGLKQSKFKLVGERQFEGVQQKVFLEGDILRTGDKTYLIPRGEGKSFVGGFVPDTTLYPGKGTGFFSGTGFQYRGKGIGIGDDALSFGFGRGGMTPISEGSILFKEGASMNKVLRKFSGSIKPSTQAKEFSYGLSVTKQDPLFIRPKVYYTKSFSPETIDILPKDKLIKITGQKAFTTSYVIPKAEDIGVKIMVGGGKKTPFATTFSVQELQTFGGQQLAQVSKPSFKLPPSGRKIVADLEAPIQIQRKETTGVQIVKPDLKVGVKERVVTPSGFVSLGDRQRVVTRGKQKTMFSSALDFKYDQQYKQAQIPMQRIKSLQKLRTATDTRQTPMLTFQSSFGFKGRGLGLFGGFPPFILPKGGAYGIVSETIGTRKFVKHPGFGAVKLFEEFGIKRKKVKRSELAFQSGFYGRELGLGKIKPVHLGSLLAEVKKKRKVK